MNQYSFNHFAIVFFSVALTLVSLDACLAKSALIKRSQYLMGTLVFVTGVASDEETAKTAVSAGLAEIRRIEHLMSTWIPTSELSKVNAAAGREPVQVSQETFEVLMRSLEMAKLTQGGFNVAVGPAVNAWDANGEGQVPSQEDLEALRPQMELSNMQLDEKTGSVWLRHPGMSIDVGGIGKGYAA
ncbi:MAG: FAD:protein FMN transferase, partial [Nitrospirales bacterium]|nr:FAD:protein FMN transferase [Nitrospirales bacterium]